MIWPSHLGDDDRGAAANWRRALLSLESMRGALLDQMDDVAGPMDIVLFQRRLAEEVKRSEGSDDPDMRYHRHLLRLMGDALAWRLLDQHTLRELSRNHLRPASVAAQGADFDFVMDVAERMASAGFMPIVADLTHLIGVGDLVTVTPAGLMITECKNTTPPAKHIFRGRRKRQWKRGTDAATYLHFGHQLTDGGEKRIAFEVNEPVRNDDVLLECIEEARASEVGAAVAQLGERDLVVSLWERALEPSVSLAAIEPCIDPEGWRAPLSAGFGVAIDNPNPLSSNPYALTLPADARIALADGDLVILRFVDLGMLEHQHVADGSQGAIEVFKKRGQYHLRALIDSEEVGLSPRFIHQVLWDFRSLAGTRSMLIEMLNIWRRINSTPSEERDDMASPAGPTFYSFAYRSPNDSSGVLVVGRLEELTRLGVSIPMDELPDTDLDESQIGVEIPAFIIREGDGWSIRRAASKPGLKR